MGWVCTYNREGNDATTEYQLWDALNSDGGIANTVADLVAVRRSSPQMKFWIDLEKREKKNLKIIGRSNEIFLPPYSS